MSATKNSGFEFKASQDAVEMTVASSKHVYIWFWNPMTGMLRRNGDSYTAMVYCQNKAAVVARISSRSN